jgi:predicted secreted protein
MPFFDKVGTRTKDYDWRMNLDIGSHVDAYNRVWYPSTVVEVGVENGSKRVRISYRRFSENG